MGMVLHSQVKQTVRAFSRIKDKYNKKKSVEYRIKYRNRMRVMGTLLRTARLAFLYLGDSLFKL